MQQNVYGDNGFYWWVGVVEDRDDPLMMGRCRVRIVGYHTPNISELPVEDLPWAHPMQPITSAAMSGVGGTPTGPVPGTWVIGFFRDGSEGQEPFIMGTLGGAPTKEYQEKIQKDTKHGFKDPNGEYPRTSYLNNNEPDTNRLARNERVEETIVQLKDDDAVTGVEVAMGGDSWNQPETSYAARYPYNHVYESESGHVFEVDDTPNAERITMYHKAGTFVDVDNNGSMIRKVVGDNYEILLRNNNVLVRGTANVTVEGSCNLYVKNNCNFEVDGDLKIHSHGDLELKAGKELKIASKLDLVLHSDVFTNISGTSIITSGPVISSVLAPLQTIDPIDITTVEFPYIFGVSRRDALSTDLDALSDNDGSGSDVRDAIKKAIAEGRMTEEEANALPPDVPPEELDTQVPERPVKVITECGVFGQQANYALSDKLSKHFTVADLTTKARAHPGKVTGITAFGRPVDKRVLSKQEIACNLKALAENVLDPIKEKYGDMIISSGFRNFKPRGGATNSQHMVGQAADLQFTSTRPADYAAIASWIKNTLTFDQMLLEYEQRRGYVAVWIHVSFNPAGCRKTFGTFWNHEYAIADKRRCKDIIVNLIR